MPATPWHWFRTSPQPGTRGQYRVWAIGDSGTGNDDQAAVRNAYLKHASVKNTDLWLLLGDLAYYAGTEEDFASKLLAPFRDVCASLAMWPTMGNHDHKSAKSRWLTGPYYDVFGVSSPTAYSGAPSGTMSYYSITHGNLHVVVLNSIDEPRYGLEPTRWCSSVTTRRLGRDVNVHRWLCCTGAETAACTRG